MDPSRELLLRRHLQVLAVFGVVALFGWLTADRGYVYQTEFSPDKLVFRSNNYFCWPFLWREQEEWSPPLLDRIREFDNGAIAPKSPLRWHFVHGHKPRVNGWHGDAKPAYRILRSESWLEWTDKHPQLAKRLWPEVIRLFRQERYGQALMLISFAKDAKTMAELDRAFLEAAKE